MSRSSFTHQKPLRHGGEFTTHIGYCGSLWNVWTLTENIEFAYSAIGHSSRVRPLFVGKMNGLELHPSDYNFLILGKPSHLWDVNTEMTTWGLEPLMTMRELAEYLGIPVSTIYDWRTNGHGPVAHRFGKHLKFALSDVRTWMETQREGGIR